ncbi:MAG TPA: SBBP repeat-containing protein [Propionicimonas sp.]
MSASQMTAPAVPESGVTGEEEEDPRRRRKALILLFLLGLLALLLGLAIWYLLFRQPVPLPPIPATQVPHFATAYYGVDRPTGIAVNAAGDRIYVTQSGGSRTAVVLDASGTKLGDMLPPTSTGESHQPTYVAIDPLTSEVYVTDRPTGDIYVYDAAGTYQRTFAPAVPVSGWQPLAIAFDKAGQMYVSNLTGETPAIEVYGRDGALTATFGATENMSFPNGIAVDDNGYVYVTDGNNGRLLIFKDGTVVGRVGRGAGSGNLGLPRGVSLDSQGRVFVVDTSGQAGFVYKQLQPGQDHPDFVGSFGVQGVGNGEFLYPTGLAIDGRGRLFVADTSNDRIQMWNY